MEFDINDLNFEFKKILSNKKFENKVVSSLIYWAISYCDKKYFLDRMLFLLDLMQLFLSKKTKNKIA